MESKSSNAGHGILANDELGYQTGIGDLILEILDALPFYVMLVDEDHQILLANGAVRDAFGLDPSGVIGRFCPKAIHGQDTPYPGCPLEAALVSGHSEICEMLDETSGRWYESAIYPTRHRSVRGKRVYFHLVRDINARKTVERERTAVAAKLEETLAKVISGFIPICANCLRIRDANGDWKRVEDYIEHRTGAEFTHSVCPACAERLYGAHVKEHGK
jgi:PAS domain S-box-containing protein